MLSCELGCQGRLVTKPPILLLLYIQQNFACFMSVHPVAMVNRLQLC